MADENKNIDLNRHLKELLKEKEDEYLQKLKGDELKIMLEKEEKLNKLYNEIEKQKFITSENFEKIRQLAISKGGFLQSEIRHEFWLKVLCLNKNTTLDTYLYIDSKIQNFKGNNIFISSSEKSSKSKEFYN